MTKIIRTNIIILSAIYFIFTACTKEFNSEIIGKSNEFSFYENFINNNIQIEDSLLYDFTEDGGTLFKGVDTVKMFDGEYWNSYIQNFLYKVNRFGNVEWEYRFNDSKQLVLLPNDISQLEDGSIIITGNRFWIEHGSLKKEYFVQMLTETGSFVWENVQEYDIFGRLFSTNDKGFVSLADFRTTTLEAYDEDGRLINYDADIDWGIVKLDNEGNTEWMRRYENINENEYPITISQVEDEGYIVITRNDGESTITKTDSRGSILNSTNISANLSYYSMINANDGGCLLATIQKTDYEIRLFKISQNGDIVWQKSHQMVNYQNNSDSFPLQFYVFKLKNLLNTGYALIIYSHDVGYIMYKFNNNGKLIFMQ